MATFTMPKINISFSTAAKSFRSRGDRGVVLQVLRNATFGGKSYVLPDASDAPAGLSEDNLNQIKNCFLGYVTPPQKVLIFVIDEDENTLEDALSWAATQQFDYICGPADITAAESKAIADWVIQQRTDNKTGYKAVLPNYSGDHESIVNFVSGGIKTASGIYDTSAYCSRIAGLLAGTPLRISATYAPLPEVADVNRMTPSEMDAAVGEGKLILWYDGTQVLTGRAVNSLKTTSPTKGDVFKKIKHVAVMDRIDKDIRDIIRSDYIGKIPNRYDNKLVLVTAIRSYLQTLESDGILQSGWTFDIDADAQRDWLKEHDFDIDNMGEQAIRESNTGSEVFLMSTLSPLDAIEDVTLRITI